MDWFLCSHVLHVQSFVSRPEMLRCRATIHNDEILKFVQSLKEESANEIRTLRRAPHQNSANVFILSRRIFPPKKDVTAQVSSSSYPVFFQDTQSCWEYIPSLKQFRMFMTRNRHMRRRPRPIVAVQRDSLTIGGEELWRKKVRRSSSPDYSSHTIKKWSYYGWEACVSYLFSKHMLLFISPIVSCFS